MMLLSKYCKYVPPSLKCSTKLQLHLFPHTHTHTHTYIYIYWLRKDIFSSYRGIENGTVTKNCIITFTHFN